MVRISWYLANIVIYGEFTANDLTGMSRQMIIKRRPQAADRQVCMGIARVKRQQN